jgi:hypothetical protein
MSLERLSFQREMAFSARWLGDLDSNQGCPGQSREFYR